jgi:SAM-dependent methyltransferase
MREPATTDNDYCSRIYARYATQLQSAPQVFNTAAARRWGKAYSHCLRGWLPGHGSARILDAGCGGNRYLDSGYTGVHGAVSPKQMALARLVTPHVAQADVFDYFAQHPARFDFIPGLDIVEHFGKDEALCFLDLLHATFKPGARLVPQTLNAESPWGSHCRYNDRTHEFGFNPNALSRLLAPTGFTAIEAREQGPVDWWGYSVSSTLRWCAWQAIRAGLKVWNTSETGDAGSGVFTRVFLILAVKS